ncbi:hypothetical protein ACIQI7_00745 [Kitasatospora sp. NPDC092039]
MGGYGGYDVVHQFRSIGIGITQWALTRADAGRRNLWLRTLDRFGLGFDS